jgi:predicted aspartyl protease
MTRVTRFEPDASLILVTGTITGPRGEAELRLVVDTGASETIIAPPVLEELGYSARDAEVMTHACSALGRDDGYLLRVARFATLGFALADFPVHVFELADHEPFDGLVGLSFLRWFNYQVRSEEGRILVENIAPLAEAAPDLQSR